MDYMVISHFVGFVVLVYISESYGQSSTSVFNASTSVFNVTTTDKPDSGDDDNEPSLAIIVGPIIGGFFVMWAVTMIGRDLYHKGRCKRFFDIVRCVHCKERCKKARVKPTKTNKNKEKTLALRPKKAIDRKDKSINKENEVKITETTNDEKHESHGRPKTEEAKRKTVTFKTSRDLSPPRMTSFQTNVGSKPGEFSDRLPPIESTSAAYKKTDNRFKNLQTTNEHQVASNWDDLLKSSNNTPHITVEGPHSVSDTQYGGYINSEFSVSATSMDASYDSNNRYEPVKLNVENEIPSKIWYADDDLSEKPVYDVPSLDFHTTESPSLDSESTTDDNMTDDSISLSSASGDLHYVYDPPPTDPPPIPPSFAKTPPPPNINVIIQDMSGTKSTPKAPPPSYDEALFYGSEPKHY